LGSSWTLYSCLLSFQRYQVQLNRSCVAQVIAKIPTAAGTENRSQTLELSLERSRLTVFRSSARAQSRALEACWSALDFPGALENLWIALICPCLSSFLPESLGIPPVPLNINK